jgi:hypothetical protein
MKKITLGELEVLLQYGKEEVFTVNKTVFNKIKNLDGQTFITENGIGEIFLKNKIFIKPKIKYIYIGKYIDSKKL